MASNRKGRIIALLLLAVVITLPLLWMVQQKAAHEWETAQRIRKLNQAPASGERFESWAQHSLAELRTTQDPARKQQLLLELASEPLELVELESLWQLIGELPEGERSQLYLRAAERFAAADPPRYFEILASMGPGNNRQTVVRNGVPVLDFPNLKKLIETVQATGSQEDIEDLAQRLHFLDEPKFSSAELLAYVKTLAEGEPGLPGQPYDLRGALVFGAGKLDADAGICKDFDALRAEFGAATADRYIEANLTAMFEKDGSDPELFLGIMARSSMGPETRRFLLNGFAGTMLDRSTGEALVSGGKLPEADAAIYFEVLGHSLASRDSVEAARVVAGMPEGKARDLMAAELAKHPGKKR